MVYVYIAAIVFAAFCIIMYFVLVAKKHEERLTKFKNEKGFKNVDVTKKDEEKAKSLTDESEERKTAKSEGEAVLQDYVFEMPKENPEDVVQDEEIDLSKIDFEALENMSDEDFDRTLNSYSPALRDAVLDELLKRNEEEG